MNASFPLYSKFKMLQNLMRNKFLSLKVCLQEKKIPHQLRKSHVAGNSITDIHLWCLEDFKEAVCILFFSTSSLYSQSLKILVTNVHVCVHMCRYSLCICVGVGACVPGHACQSQMSISRSGTPVRWGEETKLISVREGFGGGDSSKRLS